MAGFAEAAHGSDRASRIQKFDGLPELGKCTDDGYRKQASTAIPVLGNFVSSFGNEGVAIDGNPVLSASQFNDTNVKPKFMAKITITDLHSDDNF